MFRRLLLAGGVAAAAGAGFVRTTPMDPETWHADPEARTRTGRPNDYLVAEGGDRPALILDRAPQAVAADLDAIAMAEPGVERLAGSPEEGHVTYVQRSRLVGFPDAVSVRISPEGGGARVSVWSRSRYGHSDMGVNRARVERWLAALETRS
ncbi:DUF1499 domain-containing protein [Jannaschia formosa]|uniref:DUF1499 domain-containing protein n=1 Tax=Jannaschia formosa TaxID=2259592 RepID=UPI0010753AEC|nr:DUF1499 domain-containing protein [Jannaschia formosa]TFL17934.1 DUF1499 domain-containing protein [Jannaschia formosa]